MALIRTHGTARIGRATWPTAALSAELQSLMRLPFGCLMAHRKAVGHLERVKLFGLGHTVTLYDLTSRSSRPAQGQTGALEREASETVRCSPWGWCSTVPFGRRSDNVDDRQDPGVHDLRALKAPRQALVVMDAGIASPGCQPRLPLSETGCSIPNWLPPSRPVPNKRPAPGGRPREVQLRSSRQERRRRTLCRTLRKNSTRGSPAPAPARPSTMSGNASGASRSKAGGSLSITRSRSWPTSKATRPWPSPGNASPARAPCSLIPASIVCAPTSTWDPQALWRTYTMDLEAAAPSSPNSA